MSSVYSPVAAELGDITLIDDGDPKTAAGINTPIEAIADGVAFCQGGIVSLEEITTNLRILNWSYVSNAAVKVTSRPFYNAILGAWFVPGEEQIQQSRDGGQTLVDEGVADMVGETATGGDTDDFGDMVVATNSRYVFRYASGSWSRVDVHGGALAVTDTQVVHDPISGRWVWGFYYVNARRIRTSLDGATWADTTTEPSGVGWTSDDYDLFRMAVNKTTGRIVATVSTDDGVSYSGERYFAVATSDDGGVTWTTRADIYDAGTDDAEYSSLVYDEANDVWLFTHGEATGDTSRVYRSEDEGVTWTLVLTLADYCISSMAQSSTTLAGLAFSGSAKSVVYSLDAGETWHDTQLTTGGGEIFAGRGSFMVPTTNGLYTSLRIGTTDPELT